MLLKKKQEKNAFLAIFFSFFLFSIFRPFGDENTQNPLLLAKIKA
jgi:hypothetical protein